MVEKIGKIGLYLKSLVSPMETVTNALAYINSNHAQVHAGNAFSSVVFKDAIAPGGLANFIIKVPEDVYVHFQIAKISSTGQAFFIFYEGSTHGDDGAVEEQRNRNRIHVTREKQEDSAIEVQTEPTITLEGTFLDAVLVGTSGSGGGVGQIAGETGDETEWVLSPGKDYHLQVESKDASNIDVILHLFWYEESAGIAK